ncbi:DNA polymerase elongation subunit (family B) [Halovivax ruber XH-70]|uniref:DNA-directed DNA polymerase n=1 Tax=Halovivax ruber (strain DSM 18193 / JCM 13892 / XH-70) TaxID=797302 RepID=L0I947_HALRX|nr:DNA polymerase domain-containing protein [Halovivax ruber]AGB15318.1 DNA polymerase elongation subunit (family B) [Halovivax ruber XH-70]
MTRETGPFTIECEGDEVRAWYLTETGAEAVVDESYEPTTYLHGPPDALATVRDDLATDPKVSSARLVEKYTTLRDTKRGSATDPMLSVSLDRMGEVRTLARELVHRYEGPVSDRSGEHGGRSTASRDRGRRDCEPQFAPGTFRLFDVDLAPGFRYCLDRGESPASSAPGRALRRFHIAVDERALAAGDVSSLRVGRGTADDGSIESERLDGGPVAVLRALSDRLAQVDPDVLVLSHAELVPLLCETAAEEGIADFQLGRLPGWTRIAGENTYASYGQVGHSPARYRVPGRAIVDESNSFLWHQSGLSGLLYMVEASGRPLQEAAWGSIGTLLTSRQIRLARARDVPAPWNKWEPEAFKDVRTLHAADRGGFTFAPEVGLHENVHEIDFASLYPRIICERNVSPDTVDCACCGPDGDRQPRDEVPGLASHVCQDRGFLPDVLADLLTDRAGIKRRLAEDDLDAGERRRLRGQSGAIKWVLVSCFGYQGYRNAKFGRIECHEAINAYAREIALSAKQRLETGGWRIVHGIVDSLWVTPAVDDPEPLADVIADVSDDVGIPLEHDGTYEWVCFVPLRDSVGGGETRGTGGRTVSGSGTERGPSTAPGALTRYFGKRASGEYKFRGIELRQRSTPAFVADCQHEYVDVIDGEREPAAVCDRLRRHVSMLERGAVEPADLVATKRVSKSLEAYTQATHTVAALERHEAVGVPRQPGQSVEYVVVDDGASRTSERVRLRLELDGELETGSGPDYDVEYYTTLLIRAAESVVSPLGWDRDRIRASLAESQPVSLSAFGA